MLKEVAYPGRLPDVQADGPSVPKPPEFDPAEWDTLIEHEFDFSELEHEMETFGQKFQAEFETNFSKDFEQGFSKGFDKDFAKDFEKTISKTLDTVFGKGKLKGEAKPKQ